MLSPGTPAPEFTAPASTGEDITLHTLLKSGPVVLYFYNRDFTAGCTAQAREFRDAREELQGLGAHLLGVSRDGQESHQNFVKQLMLGFPLLSDPESRIIKLYKVKSFLGVVDRVSYVIGQDGLIKAASRTMMDTHKHVDVARDVLRSLQPTRPAAAPVPAP